MSDKKLKQRDEISKEYKWNIEAMYPNEAKWEEDLKTALKKAEDFQSFQGHITDSKENLYDALKAHEDIDRIISHSYIYAQMKKDEDNRNTKYVAMYDKVSSTAAKISSLLSFFTPELLKASEEQILKYIDEKSELKTYEFMLKDILREKSHVLSAAEENVMAQMSEATKAPYDIYRMLNNAELNFGEIENEYGEKVTLTHGNFINYMHSHNREVRKNAHKNMYETYKALINTISTNYSYNVKTDVINARLRKYESARQQALSGGNIPESVYDNLISVIHEYLPAMHKYVQLRKKVLGVDELKMYDVYTPLVKLPNKDIPYAEGINMVIEGLKPLGDEYIENFQAGIQNGWIDVYESEGKSSGAYSFGSYDSMPYILLNYTDTIQDVFTLAHEMGHSMHSFYTRANQPYIYGEYSIFVAEVASTVNECLLIKDLLNKETDPEVRKYLINHFIESFKSTVFRQTMFAEFEYLTHKEVENGGSLTSEWLCDKYEELNSLYFGPYMSKDEYIKYEWSRIPHFYSSFYVYQYATGFSAANAISNKILEEGETARNNYIKFLKSGSSDHPVEVLKYAGVDMATPDAIRLGMETFTKLVDELWDLMV